MKQRYKMDLKRMLTQSRKDAKVFRIDVVFVFAP